MTIGLVVGLVADISPAHAQIELTQSRQALLADQRLVGNVSAQAKREGVIINTPELFIYYSDFSAAYHLSGYRGTLARELDIVTESHRIERSMVGLDRLLERAETSDGRAMQLSDLPDADLYAVIYRQVDCPTCDQVQASVEAWASDSRWSLSFITISLDGQ